MKKFKFNLETLLTVRKQEEELAQKEFALAEMHVLTMEERVSSLKEECGAIENEMRQDQRESQNIETFRDYTAYIQMIRNRLETMQDDLMKLQNALEEKRRLLREAVKNKKVVENLREKQYSRWEQELEKNEASTLDELATIRYNRRSKQGQDNEY